MGARIATRLAWSAFVISALVGAVAVAMGFAAGAADVRTVSQPVTFLLFSFVGAAIAARDRRNPIGWIFVVLGFAFLVLEAKTRYIGLTGFAHTAGAGFASWLDWIWPPLSGLAIFVVPLLFPTGRLLSPRWRIFLWSAVLFAVIGGTAGVLAPGNPLGLHIDEPLRVKLDNLSVLPGVVALVGTLASLVVRFRRASALERQQLKWFLVASVPFILGFALHGVINPDVQSAIVTVGLIALPVSVGLAILKYRLYDIDVVINKSLVYGTLAAFITAVYVGVVVGIGSVFGNGGRPDLTLSIVATAIVAVAFQPVRERVQRLANRLVYGERATPYEVMADFSHRMSGALSIDEVLPKIAEAAGRGVGAPAARVTIFLPDRERKTVTWPKDATIGEAHILPVSYRGEPIGELAIGESAGQPIRASEAKLLADVASQAGLVLHNARLTVELQVRLAEISRQAGQLRASRQRIVAAQDDERRRLEETIRLGCEQQLSRISDELKSAETDLSNDPAAAVVALDRLTAHSTAVLEELRELARGIYPPVLQDQGLAAALRIHLRKLNPSITIQGDGIGRYPSEIEAAIYFCCVEALRGANGPAAVRLGGRNDGIDFSITGCGPLDGRLLRMEDRVEALGGSVQFDGSTLGGSIPLGLQV